MTLPQKWPVYASFAGTIGAAWFQSVWFVLIGVGLVVFYERKYDE